MASRGIRARIAWLVVASALPAIALILYGALGERERLEKQAGDELVRTAALEAQRQRQVVEGARQTLVALTRPYLDFLLRDDSFGCRDFSSEVARTTAGLYHSVGVYTAAGDLFCDATPWSANVNVADRLYFTLARDKLAFSIGEFQIGRVTGRAGINFGYPLRDAEGQLRGIGFLAMTVEEFARTMGSVALPAGGRFAILDRSGVVLAKQPPEAPLGKVGEPLAWSAALAVLQGSPKAAGLHVLSDNARWLIAHEAITEDPDGRAALRVVVAVPHEAIVMDANRALARNIALLSAAIGLVLLLGWWGAEFSVLQPLRRLLEATERMRAGDLAARSEVTRGSDEIAQLGRNFDAMAASLEARTAELKRTLALLRQEAVTDPLTGLYNRRSMQELLARSLERAAHETESVAVLMLDLDHFKQVNDRRGHEAGDEVLRRLGTLLKESIRPNDIVCRFGGEEFLLVFTGASLVQAVRRAEELREAVRSLDIRVRGEPLGTVTASLGIACYPEHAREPEALVRAADAALYEAKQAGRDRVMIAGPRKAA